MPRFRSISILFAAAVLSVSAVACSSDDDAGTDGGDDGTPAATAPPDGTQTGSPSGTPTGTPSDGDQPTSNDGTPAPTETQAPGDGGANVERVEELAPIEEINVLFLESFPVQYRLDVTSGLPSGCAAFESIEVEQDGTTFNVTVLNTMPAPDQDVACTMIYGYHESTVDLGTGLESGTEYTVNVNDKTTTFVAQ